MAGRAVKRTVKKVVRKVAEKLGRKPKETGPPSHAALVAEFMAAKRVQPDGQMAADIRKNGTGLCVLAGPRPWTIEAWVQRTSKLADVPMDWGFSAGRAFVSYLGDEEDYKRLIEVLKVTGPAFEEAAASLAKLHKLDPRTEHAYEVQWLNGAKPWEGVIAVHD